MIKILFLLTMVFSFRTVEAQDHVFTLKQQQNNTQEYFGGGSPGAVMMKVNLLGGIHRPGVYNVPVNTELSTVLSYAGGPTKEADLEEVVIRSRKGEHFEVKKIDLKEFFADEKQVPYRLRPDDYVYVHQNEEFVDNNVFRTSMVISSIVGAVLSAILIDRTLAR